MAAARGYTDGGGRAWLYNVGPTLRCPYAEGAGGVSLVAVGPVLEGVDLDRVFLMAHRANRSAVSPEDPDAAGRCRSCGAALERVGYYAWAEEPWPSEAALREENARLTRANRWTPERAEEQLAGQITSRGIALRLGNPRRVVPGSGRHFAAKRGADGAVTWAREQAQISRAADEETPE